MKAVSKLYQDDTDVLGHSQEHLADVLGLLLLVAVGTEPGQLGHAVDELGDLRPEALLDIGQGVLGVLRDVVEEGGLDRHGVDAELGEDLGRGDRMRDVWLPGRPPLALVCRHGEVERRLDPRELDTRVLEGVADALRHLVTNAVDHGCESVEERVAAGKDPVATVTVDARAAGSTVVIEVSDDGSGIDEEALRASAVERGPTTFLVDDGRHEMPDPVVVEEPLEIWLAGPRGDDPTRLAVTLRTPGHDAELAAGLLYAEGIVASAGELVAFQERGEGHAVGTGRIEVRLASAEPRTAGAGRPFLSTSACGACGRSCTDGYDFNSWTTCRAGFTG